MIAQLARNVNEKDTAAASEEYEIIQNVGLTAFEGAPVRNERGRVSTDVLDLKLTFS